MIRPFIFLLLILFGGVVFAHDDEKHDKEKQVDSTESNKAAYESINQSYLKEIKPIFKRSCFDCHSDQTNYPWYYSLPLIKNLIDYDIREARKHLDLSKDFPFIGHATPQKDLKEIEEVIEEDSMPLFRYKVLHWDAALSDEEKSQILEWVEQSLKVLSK